jgi:seryl-tRNA synthetase
MEQQKDALKRIVKDWVSLDNQIRNMQAETNRLKIERKETSLKLIELMKTHGIEDRSIEINDGNIEYKNKTSKKPLTQKSLSKLLNDFYDGNTERVEEIRHFILENREETTKEDIIRKIKKT